MIRWITDELGTAPYTDSEISGDLNVLDVRDLVDKHGNSPQATREKIDQGVSLLQQGGRLVVCCDYGISRSNAIAAGILSVKDGISLEAAIRQVMRATGEQEIKLDPLRAVRAALSKSGEDSEEDEPRVLITGGSGFIGKRLQEVLGDQVYWLAPTRSEADLITGAMELDLLVKEHRINCIVHLANPRVYTSNRAVGDIATMLRNVVEVCVDNDIRLVFPSHWEVYAAYRAKELVAAANLPVYARGPYGEAKQLCEELIANHRGNFGLKCVLLRSATVYGKFSERPKFINNFITKARLDKPIRTHQYRNGEPKLDLLHVDDYVAALIAIISSGFVGDLNIGSGAQVGTREIAEWLVNRLQSTSLVESQLIDDFSPNILMDRDEARRVLGWEPKINWQTGIERMLAG